MVSAWSCWIIEVVVFNEHHWQTKGLERLITSSNCRFITPAQYQCTLHPQLPLHCKVSWSFSRELQHKSHVAFLFGILGFGFNFELLVLLLQTHEIPWDKLFHDTEDTLALSYSIKVGFTEIVKEKITKFAIIVHEMLKPTEILTTIEYY